MISIQRVARFGALITLAASMAACAAPSPVTPSPGPPATGVTSVHDVFGDGCAQFGGVEGLNKIATESTATGMSAVHPLSFSGGVLAAGGTIRQIDVQPAVTVFVPDNNAIDTLRKSLGKDTFEALFDDPQTVSSLVRYHVLNKRYDDKGLLAAGTVQPTLEGGSLRISKIGNTLGVTDDSGATATVVCGNIPTRNGTLFVVDKLLTPRFSVLRPQAPDRWACQPSANAHKNAEICTRTTPPPS